MLAANEEQINKIREGGVREREAVSQSAELERYRALEEEWRKWEAVIATA